MSVFFKQCPLCLNNVRFVSAMLALFKQFRCYRKYPSETPTKMQELAEHVVYSSFKLPEI